MDGAPDLSEHEKRLKRYLQISKDTPLSDKDKRIKLFSNAYKLRRAIAFANPLLKFDKLLFIKRHRSTFQHMCDQYYGNFARSGGGLFVLEDPFGPRPRVRDILQGLTVENGRLRGKPLKGGSFLQPAISYDGKTVLFAYTECGLSGERPAEGRPGDPPWGVEMRERPPWIPETSYHIFRVNVDGSVLLQVKRD